MLDQALIGGITTGILALVSQTINKARCYVSCRKDPDGEYCEPQLVCGFMDTPLTSMDRQTLPDTNETLPDET